MNRANPHQGWSGAGHSEHPPEHYQGDAEEQVARRGCRCRSAALRRPLTEPSGSASWPPRFATRKAPMIGQPGPGPVVCLRWLWDAL